MIFPNMMRDTESEPALEYVAGFTSCSLLTEPDLPAKVSVAFWEETDWSERVCALVLVLTCKKAYAQKRKRLKLENDLLIVSGAVEENNMVPLYLRTFSSIVALWMFFAPFYWLFQNS